MIKSKTYERGVCCNSCQEEVGYCIYCERQIHEEEDIYCIHHSQSDCEHLHEDCKEEYEKEVSGDTKKC